MTLQELANGIRLLTARDYAFCVAFSLACTGLFWGIWSLLTQ